MNDAESSACRPRTAAVVGARGFLGTAITARLRRASVPTTRFTRDHPFIDDSGRLHPGISNAEVIYWTLSSIRPASAQSAGVDQAALDSLIDALHAEGSAARVVAISSGGTVYDGSIPPPHAETSPTRPVNAYGEAMLTVERTLRQLWPNSVVLRASNVYGPGQPARSGQGVIAYWFANLRQDEPISVIGDLSVSRDYVYIDDLTDAMLLAGCRPDLPPVINIGGGGPTTLGELVELVRDVVGREVQVEYYPPRPFDGPSTWLDVSLAAEVLHWHPVTALRDGLRRTWDTIR